MLVNTWQQTLLPKRLKRVYSQSLALRCAAPEGRHDLVCPTPNEKGVSSSTAAGRVSNDAALARHCRPAPPGTSFRYRPLGMGITIVPV